MGHPLAVFEKGEKSRFLFLLPQFTNKKGQQALMNVAGQSGGWLALLRSGSMQGEVNTHVYWEGELWGRE